MGEQADKFRPSDVLQDKWLGLFEKQRKGNKFQVKRD